MSPTSRIDVHHHFVPSKFKEAVQDYGTQEWPLPEWTLASSQDISKAQGIETAILSVTTPSVNVASSLSDQLAIARNANDTAAQLRDDDPAHFGFFTTIPDPIQFPHEALAEIVRAFDDLHADGVCLMTSYNGRYLGDAALQPLWAELNHRHAVAFVHPTTPAGDYRPINEALLPPSLDFTFETTKTACDLILAGTTIAHPDVKIILSHGGGTLPWAWHRVAQLPRDMGLSTMDFETFREQARSFYFDTALTGWGENVEFLLRFAKDGHVLYGSDFPYAPTPCVEEMTKGLDGVLDMAGNEKVREKVNWESAIELFPRLKQYREKSHP